MIERQIIKGLIISTEYLQRLRSVWDVKLLESVTARRIAGWAWEYFEKYNKAPGGDIEGIYYSKLRENNLPKDIAEEIEQDILPRLSEDYSDNSLNLDYLLSQTLKYFRERQLKVHCESIQALLIGGDVDDAEKTACNYKTIKSASDTDLDLSVESSLERVDKAFETTKNVLIRFPKQLGTFLNNDLIRGGFVAFMASEKRGKTFMLLEMAVRGCKQGNKVAFFQAGDMTESEQLRRIGVYLARKSDLKKYSGVQWEPVRDCIFNQLNDCERDERECHFGVFEGNTTEFLRDELTLDDLIKAHNENKDYRSCSNCEEYDYKNWGCPWIRQVDTGDPLTKKDAIELFNSFFVKNRRRFRISSHANGTLTVPNIKAILSIWEKQDDFLPDIVVVDYADILAPESRMEFRHQQNEIWRGLRNISQERHCLVITATQADANSFDRNRLRLSNFSEDKRKYGQVTAMWGLNQDKDDREKKIGILRINELVKREGDFSNASEVIVLQNLRRGRPFIGSYW